MNDNYIVAVYVTIDEVLQVMQYQDDVRTKISAAEIMTIGELPSSISKNHHERPVLTAIQRDVLAQNPYIERFNRIYLKNVLNFYLFRSLKEVWEITRQWISSYNQERPQDALNGMAPTPFRRSAC